MHYGKEVSIAKLRELVGTDALGTSIRGIAEGSEKLGFLVRSVYVDRASFASWDYSLQAIACIVREDGTAHYVAVYSVRNGVVRYMDPAGYKPQPKSVEEFCRDFDGDMILMISNDGFIKDSEGPASLTSAFTKLIRPHIRLFAIGVSIILTIFGIVMAIFNKVMIDEIISYSEDRQLHLFAIVLVIVAVTQILLGAFRTHAVLYISQKIDIPLVLGYFEHIFHLPMDFFSSRKTGDIITRFQDAGVIKDIFTNVALTAIIDISMVSIICVVLYTVNAQLFLITVVIAVASALLIYAFKKSCRKLNRKSMEHGARLNSQII